MQHTAVVPEAPLRWTRENAVVGSALLTVTALAWGYTIQMASMSGMAMPLMEGGGAEASTRSLIRTVDLLLFLFGWAVMMIAMMLPAALPLVLLYRAIARRGESPRKVASGISALLAGYVAVWTVAGLPVYGYSQLAAVVGPRLTVLPGLLLVAGGLYQFTALKQGCHTRCSSPLSFLTTHWRPGLPGAARLGVLHGLDCLGCCVGLMLALIALGMMNVAWMLTAAVIVFVEKTLPGGHRVARSLGVVLVFAGMVVLGASLLGNQTGG